MIEITRNETGETIRTAPARFRSAVAPWFTSADAATRADLDECAALIAADDLNPAWSSAVLGLWITAA